MSNQNTLFNVKTFGVGQPPRCSVTVQNGAYLLQTPYDLALVAAIKQLPAGERQYDPAKRAWLISGQHKQTIAGWVRVYFGEDITLPVLSFAASKTEERIAEIHYLGMVKERDNGEKTAFGLNERGVWQYVFAETVLRNWFDGTEEAPVQAAPAKADKKPKTLYSVLGLRQGATADELKAGYRRMAMQWHPDKCKEPNAHEVFLRIQDAWEILSIPGKRARYDAGLAFEATLVEEQPKDTYEINVEMYRAPLRCGLIMVSGIAELNRFRVNRILEWQDIYNQFGQVLVTSWPQGADKPMEVWA